MKKVIHRQRSLIGQKKVKKMKNSVVGNKKTSASKTKKVKASRANKSMIRQTQKSPSRVKTKTPKKKNLSQSVNTSKIKKGKKPIKLRFLKGWVKNF